MDIYLFDFTKRKNSTDYPVLSSGTKVTVYLKTPCSVAAPVFRLSNSQNLAFNYIYAPLGNKSRWYFVNDITFDGTEILISCRIDYLATWKSAISASTQYIERTSDTAQISSEKLTDAYYQVGNEVQKVVKSSTSEVFTNTLGFYVVGIAASGVTYAIRRGGISYIAMTPYQLEVFCDELLQASMLLAIIKPIDYIYSCVYIPFELPSGYGSVTDTIQLNDYQIGPFAHVKMDTITSLIASNGIIYKNIPVSISAHPDAAIGDFVKFQPFTRYRAIVGPFGEVDLPPELVSSSVSFKMYIDITDGSSVCEVYSSGSIIMKLRSKVGIPTALAQLSSNVAGLIGAGMGVAGGIGSIVAGNPIGGAIGIVSSAASAVGASIPKAAVSGQNGSYSELYDGYIHINEEFYRCIPSNNTAVGHILMKSVALNTIAAGSYIQCRDARLAIDGYDEELDNVVALMNSGFYLD